MSFLRRLTERRDLSSFPWDPYLDGRIPPPYIGNGSTLTSSGVVVTEGSALRHSAVWACVSLISDAIATLPLDVFRTTDGAPSLASTPPVLTQAAPELTKTEFVSQVLYSLLLRGNAYIWVQRSAGPYPTMLLPIHPDDLRVARDPASGLVYYEVGGEPHLSYQAGGDILHLRGMTPPGAVVGISPIEAGRQTIGLGLAVEEFGARFFGEGANPTGVLESDTELTPVAAKTLQESWSEAHGSRSRKPAVLSGGLRWKPISVNPDESQFLETRQFEVSDIARLFRVPPFMIGDLSKSTSWGSGIEQQGIGFVTYTLRPWLTRLEEGLSVLLPPPQYVRFNVNGLLRGDQGARFQAYATGRQWGWLSVNDIRALEEQEGIGPDGDIYLQPSNMVEAGAEPEPQPDPFQPPPSNEEGEEEEEEEGGDEEADDVEQVEEDRHILALSIRHADEVHALQAELDRLRAEQAAAEARHRNEVDRLRAGRRLIVHRDENGLATRVEEVQTDAEPE